MSIIETNKIDFIGIDKETNNVILTITDHLSWEDELYHIYQLQEKINSYLAYIESKEIYDTFPLAVDRSLSICIIFLYEIPLLCVEFLNKIESVLSDLSVKLIFEQHLSP